ncbi:MAG TPA: PKD domain-containing protein, partial [Thermoplasmata archaeon]|nr:PKD domain-containing protein [Thermoplasmata archaeon]
MGSRRGAAAVAVTVIVILLLLGALLFSGAIPSPITSTSGKNLPPVALIDTASHAAKPRERVDFDGSKSKDPDGTIVSYRWDFGDGGAAGGPKAAHAFATSGNFTVKLEVVDDGGAGDSDSLVMLVKDAPPPPPPPGGCTVVPSVPAGLRATAKSASSVSLVWNASTPGT